MKKIKYYIEGKIKRMLRKWLKKKMYCQGRRLSSNEERFYWVYDAPLREWKDRIWCLENRDMCINPDSLLEYIYKK